MNITLIEYYMYVAQHKMYLYTGRIMMNPYLQSILDSFTDVAQNPISLTIFALLTVLIIVLLLATLFPSWRNFLIRTKVLEQDEKPSSMLTWFIATIIIVKLIQACVVQPFIVDGASMLPTFHDKEFLFVDKLSYLIGSPHRGDVVVFKFFENRVNPYEGKYLIKRIIGLPGERVTVNNGVTTIYNVAHPNGFILEEPYIVMKKPVENVDMTLDSHHYFVMGDNRAQSYDGRSWGPLEMMNIKGQVLLRVFPFTAFSYEPGRYLYTQ
jgi:signal peptidase I